MTTRFFTNENDNTLLNKFRGIFEFTDIDCFDALVGYFYTSGYFAIRPLLNTVPHIRILVGIDADRIIAEYNQKGLRWNGNNEETVKEAMSDFRKDIASCRYSHEIEKGIKLFIEDVATGKIEIRAHTTRKLHAKIYIFRPEVWNEHNSGVVITGSSNLTDAGLGASQTSNYEFNVQLKEYDDVQFATDEFEKLWNEAAELHPSMVAETLKKETHLSDQITPFELYVKMLACYFDSNIDYSPDSIELPPGYKQLSYQIDAVNQGFDKLCRYNGFFLADVVGLGKTVIAILIAKKFFYSNGISNGHVSKTLIICPPALTEQWKKTAEDFGLKEYTIITNGSIHKEKDRFATYDLVIVDEAHKFRNQTNESYSQLSQLCKTPSSSGCTLGKTPYRKKVILISATLQNNGPDDIKNLTYLFQDARDTDLDIPDLEAFFKHLAKRYNATKNLDAKDMRKEIQEVGKELRESIIYPLTVRRTRADLINNELYSKDLKKQGIVFPSICDPEQMLYNLDSELNGLFDETLECLTSDTGLNYSRYKHIAYLIPEHQQKYNKGIITTANNLPEIMKNILVKRLDSSFQAFKKSLKHFLDGVNAMLQMLDNDCVYVLNKVSNLADLVLNDEDDKLEELFEKKENAEKYRASDFGPDFREDLIHDRDILKGLASRWDMINDDPKYNKFLEVLKSKLLNKEVNPSGKIVIFSEAEDTTNYLAKRLKHDGFTRTLAVSAGNRDILRETIAENFDANLSKEEQKNDYDIIICTEVLAEGINLHRAGLVVNYDTPWNSTRLMQRIGRINRIGSANKFIRIYNFFPTAEVNETINLEKTAKRKLLAFHHALGDDSKIYAPDDEEAESFGLFSTNPAEERDEQLSALLWVRKFKEEQPKEFQRIKDLPLRIRTGRNESTESQKQFPAEATIAYLKSAKRDTFFAVSGNDEPQTISFLDAERLLRCQIDEPRRDVPDIHYDHIAQFMDLFEKQEEEVSSKKQATHELSSKEEDAVEALKAMLRKDFINDEYKNILKLAIEIIKKKQFPNFAKEINDACGKKVKESDKFPKLLETIQKYIKDTSEEQRQERETIDVNAEKPNIVISETFVHCQNSTK